jgi:hypothetical protein
VSAPCPGCLSEARQLAFEDLYDRYATEGMDLMVARVKAATNSDAEAVYYVESGYVDCHQSHSDPIWGVK